MRQASIAVFAMLLVLAVSAYDGFTNKDTAPKVQISGTVTQWSALGVSGRDNALSFRVGVFPFELGIQAPTLELLAKHGVTQPLHVGAQVEAIVAKSDVAAARDLMDGGSRQATAAIPVLALRVAGKPLFGTPEAFRLRPSMSTWPYLLLLSVAGAALFFGHRRRRRGSRRV